MASHVHVVVVVLLSVIPAAIGYGRGAPTTACVTMSPSHNVTAQSDKSPYTLDVSAKEISKSGILKVCVKGKAFKGILLQMRAADGTVPVGTFNGTKGILANDTTLVKCTADGDTVTHSNPKPKASPTCFFWIAPDKDVPAKLHFVATIVESVDVYWTDVKSDPISANSGIASGVGFTTIAVCSLLAVVTSLLQ